MDFCTGFKKEEPVIIAKIMLEVYDWKNPHVTIKKNPIL